MAGTRDLSVDAPSQWETMLHWNIVSYWLGAYAKWSLRYYTETTIYEQHMMTSSNGDIFRVTGHLCGEFTGHQWIPHTKARDAELWCFLWSAPCINGWVNNREAGVLRRHWVHYDIVMNLSWSCTLFMEKMVLSKKKLDEDFGMSQMALALHWLVCSFVCVLNCVRS